MFKAIKQWLSKLFGKHQAATPAPVEVTPQPTPIPIVTKPMFVADFSSGQVDPSQWTISTWAAPGGNRVHIGKFAAENVAIIDGVLRLTLDQTVNNVGVVQSLGAELTSTAKFSYGTYEWIARASSTAAHPNDSGTPVSGSITGCFNYVDQSATEIDFEVEGNARNNILQLTSWINAAMPNEHTDINSSTTKPHEVFCTYKFVWTASQIQFYRDEVLLATHKKVVPSTPAYVLMNHWGTNDANWGGAASPGVARYVWVKKFTYTPL